MSFLAKSKPHYSNRGTAFLVKNGTIAGYLAGSTHINHRTLSGFVLAFLVGADVGADVEGQSSLADSESPGGHRQDSPQGQERSGEEVFVQACFSCHGTGFYGAPVISDIYAWEDRLPKGEQALLKSTIEGLNSMPARGGCANCSDADIQAAVHYLITN